MSVKLFSIFLIAAVIDDGVDGASNCLNYFDRNPVTVSCRNLGLADFPPNITDQVRYLDLSGNSLESLPGEIGRLLELRYLNVGRNRLRNLPEEFGELWRLERLDLSHNDIKNVNDIAAIGRLPALRILYLRSNPLSSLDGLTSPAIRALDVSHCSMKNLSSVSLIGLPELVSLNSAGNPLRHLQNIQSYRLKWLDLSSCQLNYLVPDTFKGVPVLEHLRISNNPTLVYSTRRETLRHSALTRLEASSCNLDRPGLHGLPALTHVTLSQNVIRFLPDRIFMRNPSLIQLNLSGNGLSRLNESSFVGMPKLEHLDLSANSLEELPPAAFRDNILLATLNLSYNDLRNFPNQFTTSAVSLDLSTNLIESLPEDALVNMWRIVSLDLSKNRLEKFDAGTGSKTLSSLNIGGNRLTELLNESFVNLPALEKLDLSGNRLTEGFPPELFGNNPELQVIRLHDNPWRCDCAQLSSLYFYLAEMPRRTSLAALICHSPNNVSGYTWSTACGSYWNHQPAESFENKAFAIAMIGVLLAFFAFGSAISIGHTIKTKRRQAELRLREAERAEARERLILHRRSRELEAERTRREQHEPRVHPSALVGPPTYEEAVEMPLLTHSLDNLNEISTEGLGQSQQSLAQEAWERKKRMQSRKRAPKRAHSENDLLSRRDERSQKATRTMKKEAPALAMKKLPPRAAVVQGKTGERRESESEEPMSDGNGTWSRIRRSAGKRKRKRVAARRNRNSSDDEESDARSKATIAERRGYEIEVIELPREPRSGRYRPPSSPSLISSPELSSIHEISRSKIV